MERATSEGHEFLVYISGGAIKTALVARFRPPNSKAHHYIPFSLPPTITPETTDTSDMSNEEEPRGLNILCIDGGGVCGLSSLIVLKEVMNRLEGLRGDNMAPKPADCFDLIAGSGTGGGRGAYKGTRLREGLREIISKFGKDNGMMEEESIPGDCKTIVFAMSKHNVNAALPTMFRSYKVSANRGPDCTLLDALHATMAHPNLFKDIEIGDGALRQSFVGGDLGCSNPMVHVLAEVKRVYPGRHVSCILSIGAGHARTISIPDYSLREQLFRTQDLVAMKNMATDSERVAEEMAIRFEETRGVYFRLNVDQLAQDAEAEDWERLNDVTAHTKAYLLNVEIGRRINELAQAIKRQDNVVETESIAGQVRRKDPFWRTYRSRQCPAPTPVYTGRKDEAKQVIECILETSYERPVCVIYGLGGSGKTQLALKVVEQTRNEWVEIIYIDGTSRGAIESALMGSVKSRNIGHTYQDAVNWLESCLGRWLMVFDNVDDPSREALVLLAICHPE
ncbi:unnamed protein product [Rhizoctonia solani]|uniref:PNPLA domain-containing protein n=1 Tax=Rhizoctonia solani TaxID=456999 RepID=A0A8H3CS83_9AGAM|nr:unnamed protein product [Rhizoctonia solani]